MAIRDVTVFDELTEKWSDELQKAFLSAVEDIKSDRDVRLIERAIERGDIQEALDIAGVDETYYSEFDLIIRQAFLAGGTAALGLFANAFVRNPQTQLLIRFNPVTRDAQQHIERHELALFTNLKDRQREAISDVVTSGLEDRRSAAQIALDISGRVNRRTGKREGGVIGLTRSQVKRLIKLRRSGASQFKIKTLANQMLRQRAKIIADFSSRAQMNAAKFEAARQAVAASGIPATDTEKSWFSRDDGKVRDSHVLLHATTVSLNKPFVASTGAFMMHPHDTSLGAKGHDVIGCRCTFTVSLKGTNRRVTI